MSKYLNFAAALCLLSAPAFAEGYGLGRPALPEEIAAWDLDVSPDGTGLPEGAGDVITGEELFVDLCASCHGDFAEGRGNWPKLAGGDGSLADKDPVKTVGSYWPHLSTTWDYVNRSMPFGNAQSLEPDDVYAIVAYILYSNYIVDEDFELTHENFSEIVMPNVDGFFEDDRLETEFSQWVGDPCMADCKEKVEVVMRAMVLDVTPEEEPAEAVAEPAPETTQTASVEVAAVDPALVEEGEKVFRKCKACHQVGDGAKNRSGPVLNGIIGRAAGSVDGFKYSGAFKDKAQEGLVWDAETLAAFLAAPRSYIKGTKMAFAGLKSEEDIAAITAYLQTFPK